MDDDDHDDDDEKVQRLLPIYYLLFVAFLIISILTSQVERERFELWKRTSAFDSSMRGTIPMNL